MSNSSFAINQIHQQFIEKVASHDLVIESSTGSGKSTHLPVWLAQLGLRVLVVEPRRLACVALAQFLTVQHPELVIGHAIRFYSDIEPQTQIAFVTPGVALRWLSESGLQDFDVVLIDEFHERRWDTDLLLAILKQENNQRIVVTSATIHANSIASYLNSNSLCLSAHGQQFPVNLTYMAESANQVADNYNIDIKVKQAVVSLLADIQAQQISQGAILVFLAGKAELSRCQYILADLNIELLCLHGGSAADIQQQVLNPSQHLRIILTTNVAETSVTIADVIAVIDSGLERRTIQKNGRSALSLMRISKASADQRMGRAGRTQAGVCIRLWGEFAPMEAATPPEMQRLELTEAMLAAASAGYNLAELSFIEPLPDKSLQLAKQQLLKMAAIDHQGVITAHGQSLFPLPIDSQFAHLISAMTHTEHQQLMVDLAAALTIGNHWYTLPNQVEELTELQQWLPITCDAFTMIKLVRGQMTNLIVCDPILLNEVQQLSTQIRAALALPELSHAAHIDHAFIAEHRIAWLTQVIKQLPELVFIRRVKRNQTFANGVIELQQAKQTRIDAKAQAAVVFDTFTLAGKGSKSSMILATCMAEVPLSLLVECQLGERQPAQLLFDDDGMPQMMIERHYGGRVIESCYVTPQGPEAVAAIAANIMADKLFVGCGEAIQQAINSYQLWLLLPDKAKGVEPLFLQDVKAAVCPPDGESYLVAKLTELGIESYQDLELIDEQDLLFKPLPDWLWQPFIELYPAKLTLADLSLQVQYQLSAKKVLLKYDSGARKTDPQRWELPRWQGWRIQYQKASRVIDIK